MLWSLGNHMSDFLITLYDFALVALQWLGGDIGKMELGYFIANIVVFVLVQPGLILLFLMLWLHQKRKNRQLEVIYNQTHGVQNV